eukprot:2155168-Amphidinium_carterae.1
MLGQIAQHGVESVGTVGYMSPETINPKIGRKGPCSDVFGFAMLTHFCITRICQHRAWMLRHSLSCRCP